MPIVTTPYNNYRKGSTSAIIVKEVSGVTTGDEAYNACGLTQYTSTHPEDQGMICDGWDAQKIAPDFFAVTFTFALKDYGTNERPTRINWDPGLSSETFDRDVDGNPIVNSALDPFDDGTQREIPDVYFTVTKSMRTPFDVQRAINFMGKVNDGAMTIMGHKLLDRQCFCRQIAPVGEYTTTAKWVDVVHRFQMREQGFDGRFLDQGRRGWHDGPSRDLSLIEIFHPIGTVGSDGLPSPRPLQISEAVRLDGRGKPLEPSLVDNRNQTLKQLGGPPKGAKVEIAPEKKAVFLIYKKYKAVKFQQLGL